MSRADKISATIDALVAALPSPSSRRAYVYQWETYTTWLAKQKPKVKPLEARQKQIAAYAAELVAAGRAKKTIAQALSVLREVYSALVRDEYLDFNPAREIKTPRSARAPKRVILTAEELTRMLALPATGFAGVRDKMCLELLAGLGWRRSEVARMQVTDIFTEAGVTYAKGLRKGGKTTTVRVPEHLARRIRAWLPYSEAAPDCRSAWLLPRSLQDSRPISGDIVYDIVKAAAARAGVPLERATPHAMRRAYATILDERGADLRELQAAMSHSNIATTEGYIQSERGKKSAPGDRLADIFGEPSNRAEDKEE